jgi:protein required for attachment to host cells
VTRGTWILVADASRARLFGHEGSALKEIADFVHVAGRSPVRELESDRPGRSFGTRPTHHAMQKEHDARQTEGLAFTRELVARLESGRNRHEFRHLVLIAPPEMLGHLRECLPAPLAGMVRTSIHKDLVRAAPEQILAAVGEV